MKMTDIAFGRLVEYSAGYRADHRCISYQVADHAEPHRSSTPVGAKLFVVD